MPAAVTLDIVNTLCDLGLFVIVVNDGSGRDFDGIFDKAAERAVVLTHSSNKGKGEALKTGLRYIKAHAEAPYTIVTVDADGQHGIDDIKRVFAESQANPDFLVIGSRRLDSSSPIKSRIGNGITNVMHRIVTDMKLSDTQTGLRAFSDRLIDKVLGSGGKRYEFETFMLLNFAKEKNILEVPIETIYIDNNSASHFRPFKDAMRLYNAYFRYAFLKNSDKFNK